MASRLTDIGFNFEDRQDRYDFLTWAYTEQAEVYEQPLWKMAVYQQESGIQCWFPLNEEGEPADYNFHYVSGRYNPIRVMKCLQSDTEGKSGLYACEVDLDEGNGDGIPEVPINLFLPAAELMGPLEPGGEYEAQIACFAETITVYRSKKEHEAAVKKGSVTMAAEGFIPSGTFGLQGDMDFEPSPRAIISGIVEKVERKINDYTGQCFDYLQVYCLGMDYDVLVDPILYDGLPETGAVVHGLFWMSALVWEKENTIEQTTHKA